MEQQTLEQFGANIRWKYPQYAKYSNKEIANQIIQKYPVYAQNISDLNQPQKEEINPITKKPVSKVTKFLSSIGNALTSSAQKFGTSAGQSFAGTDVISKTSQAEQQASDVELNLTKKINEDKQKGLDTSRLERTLSDLKGRQGVTSQVKEIIPSIDKTNRQVIGEAIGTGVEALSGGVLKGVSGFGVAKNLAPTATEAALSKAKFLAKPLGGRLAQIGVETAKDVATLAPFGYAYDVSQNLQEDKSGASILKPGSATLLSTLIPVGIGTIRAGRQATADLLSNVVSPNLSGVESSAYKRLRTGEVSKYLGKETPESVLNEARVNASAFKSAMQKQFGEGSDQIINEFTGKRIGLNEKTGNKLNKISEKFGFNTENIPNSLQNMSPKETIDLLKEINSVSPITQLDDPLTKSFKLNLMEIKNDIVKKAVNEFGGEGGKFEKLYTDYTRQSKILKDVQSIIGKVSTDANANSLKLTPIQQRTAQNRLQKVFASDATSYLDTIKQLEKETGSNILDRVAASQLSQIMPKNLSRLNTGVIGIAGDILSLVTFPVSSPRVGAWLISQVGGYGKGIVTRLLNASPNVRKAIYDAVTKENMSFNDAVELYAKDYLKNPKMGLGIEDVSQKSPNMNAVTGKTTQNTNNIAKNTSINDTIPQLKKKVNNVPVYKGEKDLTTKILKDLEGKTTVSKQYILDATNRGELKQVERDLVRNMLEGEKDVVNVSDFAKKVKAELLPLKVLDSKSKVGYGTRGTRYENISLPDELKGKVKNYEERVYQSPLQTSAGQVHFGDSTKNYFGHTRIEDMADNQTRRVIEVQSDLYQKGNLEQELPHKIDYSYLDASKIKQKPNNGLYYVEDKSGTPVKFAETREQLIKDLSGEFDKKELKRITEVKKLQQYNDPTAHFRMVREEIKKAAQDGKTKLQFPTGETAMKIEGLGDRTQWYENVARDGDYNIDLTRSKLLTNDLLKVGKEINQSGNQSWIITDVLGDGKFKAVPKEKLDGGMQRGKMFNFSEKMGESEKAVWDRIKFNYAEEFDISGKVDTNNPIYKFYEKDMGKYLTSRYNAKIVTDNKGVRWYQVDIKPEMGKTPVDAFGKITPGVIGTGALIGVAGVGVAGKLQNKSNGTKR